MGAASSTAIAGAALPLDFVAEEPHHTTSEPSSPSVASVETTKAHAECVEQPKQLAPVVMADIEAAAKTDPHFAAEATAARQAALGLDASGAQKFIDECEFISLGSYCGASSAIAALGLRKSAYPLDWCRSPIEGIIHCFDHGFVDFLTFSGYRQENGIEGYLSTRWGGSFWHHKPDDPKVRDDFVRRVERMLGYGSVPACKPRVFVRAVNSTRELDFTTKLYEALQGAMPQSKIYLLILIDVQDSKGAVRIAGGSDNILFYRIHSDVWEPPFNIHRCDDPYGEAIAYAIHYWSGKDSAKAEAMQAQDIGHIQNLCRQFDGGCAATELMAPKLFTGAPISLKRNAPADKASRSKRSTSVRLHSVEGSQGTQREQPQQLNGPDPHTAGKKLPPSLSSSQKYLTARRAAPGFGAQVPEPQSTLLSSRKSLPALQSGPVGGVQPPAADVLSRTHSHAETRDEMNRTQPILRQPQISGAQQPQYQDVVLPDGVRPGDVVLAMAFGKHCRVQVPQDACSNQLLRLQYMNGAISCAAAATTMAVMAASATMASSKADVQGTRPESS